MIKTIGIDTFLTLDKAIPVADVRTPAEFEQGHICGANNLPLFTNEERVQVGTTYKQVGREEAILLGFDLTGPKWSGYIKRALEISPEKKIALYCWRGGMRSGAMAWALNLYGFEVYLLQGGYKKYRRWVLDKFENIFNIQILGGLTGSGKTRVLAELKTKGEQVIDLEDIAQHQGSAYGSMNAMQQPSQEQFENNLATQLKELNPTRQIWIEDESITIGKRFIPKPLWNQMRASKITVIKVASEARVNFLVEEYGKLDKEFLKNAHKKYGSVLALNKPKMPSWRLTKGEWPTLSVWRWFIMIRLTGQV